MWFPFVDHQPTFWWWNIPTYAADSPIKNDGFCLLPPRFIPWGAMLDLGSVFLGGHPWEHLQQLHCLGIDAALKVCRYVPLWLVVTSQVPFLFFYADLLWYRVILRWFQIYHMSLFLPCSIISIPHLWSSKSWSAPLSFGSSAGSQYLLDCIGWVRFKGPRVNPIDPPLGYCVNPFPVISYVYIYVCAYIYVSMHIMCLEFISFVAELSIQHPNFLDCQEMCCIIPPFTGRGQPMTLPMTSPK